MTADELRARFIEYFVERGHTIVPSSGLIPSHPAAPLFTNAGMVQFLPIFFGEEPAPWARATSAQKCLRVRGKHDDIEQVGRTTRHLTFFEMLGNFSFGDYFKREAIAYGWDFLTSVLGIDGDRLWATVHESDDAAADLWVEVVNLPPSRIQRLGEDNFWEMGATGPCGPSSEIFYDKGPEFGPEGGPAQGGEERFVEIWNLVFMQFNRLDDGALEPLPKQNIDTGAGLERILPIIQEKSSVFDTDVLRDLIAASEELTGSSYGRDEEDDVSLRILADHARAVTFLVADGVVPSNEERGYVVRRIIRRAVRHAQRLGAHEPVLAELASAVTSVMRGGYPDLEPKLDRVRETVEREEHRFRDSLTMGLSLLERELADGLDEIAGETAFKLHDTYGFPIELTAEIAAERNIPLDREGFERAMERQRELARGAQRAGDAEDVGMFRQVLDEFGPTEFLGYACQDAEATLVAVVDASDGELEVFSDKTPFYGESGGQIGDTGAIRSDTGEARVLDCDRPLPGLIRHRVRIARGTLAPGQSVQLEVDEPRRSAIRRAHTATHLLHWALRETIGHQVHQQGSLVGADYLRFDFNHHSPLTDEERERLEDLVTREILTGAPVATSEMPLQQALATGAMSFFGEKYADVVRVVQAGPHSIELCGGTHVAGLGQIGSLTITSESSVGANLRRIEALTGEAAHEDVQRQRRILSLAADALRVAADEVPQAVSRLRETQQREERERRRLATRLDRQTAVELAQSAVDGIVVSRVDDRDQDAMRQLAAAVRDAPGVRAVGLVGSPDGTSVAIAVALDDGQADAPSVVRLASKAVGGGGGGKDPRMAVGGGRDVDKIDVALSVLEEALRR